MMMMMSRGSQAFVLLLCCLFASSLAQSITVTSIGSTYVGVDSDYLFFSASQAPNGTTITIQLSETTGNVQFSPSSVQLNSETQGASFRVKCSVSGAFTIQFTYSGDDINQFAKTTSATVNFLSRTMTADFSTATGYVGLPSEPLKVYINVPSTSALTFTPTADIPEITFSPATITIPAGSLSATFTYISSIVLGAASSHSVTWVVDGSEVSLYASSSLDGFRPFSSIIRPITVSSLSTTVQLGRASTAINVYTRQAANASFTVTPRAVDTVFSPSSFTFSPSAQLAQFTFTSTTAESAASKTVYFYTSGDGSNLYVEDPTTTFSVVKKTITVTVPSVLVVTNTSRLSITLTQPVANSLTVSFYASNVVFNVSSVTFTGNQTSADVDFTSTAIGSDIINFYVSGADVDYYNTIADVAISSITRGTFVSPAAWYNPSLYVGVVSDRIPIRASYAPKTSVTITPAGADLIFTPASLTFGPGEDVQQYFTITPTYVDVSVTRAVTFAMTGADAQWFTLPSGFTATINTRSFQTKWSAHLYTSTLNTPSITSGSDRHLGKTYKVWATVNYINEGDLVSYTPVNPYFSFEPAVLNFNAKTTRIQLLATVIGVAPSGSTTINYIVGGKDGGLYPSSYAESVNTKLRPLSLAAAVIAPDNRIEAKHTQLFQNPSTSDLAGNYVYSFLLQTPVLPDKSLKITPRSSHVEFKPSSITIKPSGAEELIDKYTTINSYIYASNGLYAQANFSTSPLAAGVHEVWFELEGDDASYYVRPAHTYLSFNMELRPKSEPGTASAIIPSIFAIGFVAIASLFL